MRSVVHVAALGLTLLLAACGQSGSSTPATTPSAASSIVPSTSAGTTISEGPAGDLSPFPAPTVNPPSPSSTSATAARQFVTAVFSDAQQDWRSVFQAAGQTYTDARLQLFTAGVHTACGAQSSEVGPFYCPADHTVYLDVTFFTQLENQFGVQGDFAQAYVVAHELGHHIQTITGTTAQVNAAQQANPTSANALSVRTELQADCYAGVWAHSTYRRGLLEPGDLEEALTAAAAVGDDFLQHAAAGSIEPEQWTHGSSAQRQQWLNTGYESGEPASCNTFSQ
jgi:uncharacterized protein